MPSISGSPDDPDRSTIAAKPVLDIAAHLAGFVPSAVCVTADEYAARLKVCSTCIYRVVAPVGERCAACGCFIALKAKLSGFHCPQLKWPGDTLGKSKCRSCGSN